MYANNSNPIEIANSFRIGNSPEHVLVRSTIVYTCAKTRIWLKLQTVFGQEIRLNMLVSYTVVYECENSNLSQLATSFNVDNFIKEKERHTEPLSVNDRWRNWSSQQSLFKKRRRLLRLLINLREKAKERSKRQFSMSFWSHWQKEKKQKSDTNLMWLTEVINRWLSD
jgi:hypothetical protein